MVGISNYSLKNRTCFTTQIVFFFSRKQSGWSQGRSMFPWLVSAYINKESCLATKLDMCSYISPLWRSSKYFIFSIWVFIFKDKQIKILVYMDHKHIFPNIHVFTKHRYVYQTDETSFIRWKMFEDLKKKNSYPNFYFEIVQWVNVVTEVGKNWVTLPKLIRQFTCKPRVLRSGNMQDWHLLFLWPKWLTAGIIWSSIKCLRTES